MLIFLWLLGGLAVVKLVAPSKEEKSSANPVLGDDVAQIMANANNFFKVIKDASASPSQPNFKALAEEAHKKKDAEEAAARKYINDTFDKYRDAASAAAVATGYGIVAVPVIIMAAQIGKWAANAQITLFKWLGVSTDGWSETWQANLQGELSWLIERGIPFPAWNDGKGWNSPMGWVNGGGGDSCGHGGLCSIREAYGKFLPPLETASAMSAFTAMKRHLQDNPLVLAAYTKAGEYEGSFYLTYGYSEIFNQLFIAGLASAVCQERGVLFVQWKLVMEKTMTEFNRLFTYHKNRGAHFPFAESLGSTYNYAVQVADQAKIASGGVLVISTLKFS